ncbi:MAG: hypothetical protein O2783_07065 [Chloroflexi bacterium]|nr:hypothetical protein [Chloroflexota bacterium]
MMRENVVVVHVIDGGMSEAIVLTANFHQDGDQWLGEGLELGTATFADTLEDVRKELAAAMILQVNEMNRLGFADEFLADHGVQQLPIPHVHSGESSGSYVGAGVPA